MRLTGLSDIQHSHIVLPHRLRERCGQPRAGPLALDCQEEDFAARHLLSCKHPSPDPDVRLAETREQPRPMPPGPGDKRAECHSLQPQQGPLLKPSGKNGGRRVLSGR